VVPTDEFSELIIERDANPVFGGPYAVSIGPSSVVIWSDFRATALERKSRCGITLLLASAPDRLRRWCRDKRRIDRPASNATIGAQCSGMERLITRFGNSYIMATGRRRHLTELSALIRVVTKLEVQQRAQTSDDFGSSLRNFSF
jgi:hypothetical protein